MVRTVVDEPQGTDSRDSERHTVSPLGRDGGVRGITAAVVEAKQQYDEYDLVEELTPALHQESTSDLAATVEAIFLGRDLSGAGSILHTTGGGHGVFTSNTDTVEEQRPSVANNPAVLGDTPGGGKHDQTDKHNCGILNQTPATAKPRKHKVKNAANSIGPIRHTSHREHRPRSDRQ